MRVRAMDSNGDMQFGRGSGNFLIDSPDAVAQVIGTRLRLQTNEWFLAVTDGTDWRNKVLGKYTRGTRDMVIRNRVLGTPGVTGIASGTYSSTFDPETRAWRASMTVETAYGAATLSESL